MLVVVYLPASITMPTVEQSALGIFLPAGVLEWFTIVASSSDEDNVCLILEEKNIPPLAEADRNKPVISKGFKDITITDFPIRGRRALLTFRRRYWQIEGQNELLKRDIPLSFPGTQLEREFAHFLKEDGGRTTGLAGFYRRVSAPPDQGI